MRLPFFDDGHRDLTAELERWAADVLPSLLFDIRESEGPAAYSCVKRLVPALGEAGLLQVCIPKAYGGARDALDVRSIAVAREILAHSARSALDAGRRTASGGCGIVTRRAEESMSQIARKPDIPRRWQNRR